MNTNVSTTTVKPGDLVELGGRPFVFATTHAVRLHFQTGDGKAGILLLEPEEAIALGRDIYARGRAARRSARKDSK